MKLWAYDYDIEDVVEMAKALSLMLVDVTLLAAVTLLTAVGDIVLLSRPLFGVVCWVVKMGFKAAVSAMPSVLAAIRTTGRDVVYTVVYDTRRLVKLATRLAITVFVKMQAAMAWRKELVDEFKEEEEVMPSYAMA